MTGIASKDLFEMPYVHDQEVVKALPPDGAHELLGNGVCDRRSRRGIAGRRAHPTVDREGAQSSNLSSPAPRSTIR